MASSTDLQKAAYRERRALEQADRLKLQSRSQAALLTRLFQSKLNESADLLQRALDRAPRAEIEEKREAFNSSIAWIFAEENLAQSEEVERLREENARLLAELDRVAAGYIDSGGAPTAAEPAAAERRIADLEREVDALRGDVIIAQARALETSQAGGRGMTDDAEVDALRATVSRLESGDSSGEIAELRATLERERKEYKKKAKAKRDEKEQLMAAMEKEVETLIAEERAKFDREKDKLEKAVVKAKKSGKGSVKALATLAKQVAVIKPEIDRLKREAREALKQMPKFSAGVAEQIAARVGGLESDLHETQRKYKRELGERKRLHNLVQELRGNIRVFCRVRPPSKREREHAGDELSQCVSFPNDGEIKVVSNRKDKTWAFDRVFDFTTSQDAVYAEVSELVTSVLDGFNVCIFAYGQTGSGKTFTMTGPSDNRGCNLRALRDLFTKSKERSEEVRDEIKVSVLEIYNEQIRDLLSADVGQRKLEVRRGDHGNFVPDLTMVDARSDDEVLELMAISDKHRSSTSTNMNEASSRSHMLMSIEVVSKNLTTGAGSRGKLHLVDLAGSERIDKSGATGQALKEAQNINKSLSALGDVIAARGQGQNHIPFRNSTLTHLLQDSLSQDSKTLMFCCVSPVLYNADETMCTLNFAARVNNVELGRASKNTTTGATGASAKRK